MQLDNNIINFIKTHPGDDGAKSFYLNMVEDMVMGSAAKYKSRYSHIYMDELKQQVQVIALEVLETHNQKTSFKLGGFYAYLKIIINQKMTRYFLANLRPLRLPRSRIEFLDTNDATDEAVADWKEPRVESRRGRKLNRRYLHLIKKELAKGQEQGLHEPWMEIAEEMLSKHGVAQA